MINPAPASPRRYGPLTKTISMNNAPLTPFQPLSKLANCIQKVILSLAAVASCTLTTAHAETGIETLTQAMKSGDVVVVSITGNGSSSGAALEGYLVNRTSIPKNLDIWLDIPLFLENESSGQDMVATQIYRRDGSYMSDGERSFISLESANGSR